MLTNYKPKWEKFLKVFSPPFSIQVGCPCSTRVAILPLLNDLGRVLAPHSLWGHESIAGATHMCCSSPGKVFRATMHMGEVKGYFGVTRTGAASLPFHLPSAPWNWGSTFTGAHQTLPGYRSVLSPYFISSSAKDVFVIISIIPERKLSQSIANTCIW